MILISCACGYSGQVPEKFAGAKVKCKKCSAILPVPVPREAPEGDFTLTAEDETPAPAPVAASPLPPRQDLAVTGDDDDNSPVSVTFPRHMKVTIAADETSWFEKGFHFGCGLMLSQFVLVLLLVVLYLLLGALAIGTRLGH